MDKTLQEFMTKIGDAKASILFDIKLRTAKSYRLKERFPSVEVANMIVKKTRRHKDGPVTFEGIYKMP